MAYWYYYNNNDEKIGPVSATTLKELVQQGLVTRETKIENGNGRSALAGSINGLTFPDTIPPQPEISPFAEPNPFASPAVAPANPFALPVHDVTNPFAVSNVPMSALSTQQSHQAKDTTGRKVILVLLCVCLPICLVLFAVVEKPWSEESQRHYQEIKQRKKEEEKSTRKTKKGSSRNTKESFDSIQMGMSYSEVVGIVGEPSETSADSRVAGTSTTIYTWHVNDSLGANFNITFQNSRVIGKAQFGLR